jgi:hypothetical protein
LGPPRWHAGAVQAVAFSHRGDRIVSGSHDRTARFWRGTTEPLQGPWQAIKAWAEVLAGVELDAGGAERPLGPKVEEGGGEVGHQLPRAGL